MQAFRLSGLTCSILCPSTAMFEAADLRRLTSIGVHILPHSAAELSRRQSQQGCHEHCMLLSCLWHLTCYQEMPLG